MIIWLASYPRSGNTLLRMALKSLGFKSTYSLHEDSAFQRIGISELVGHENMPDRSINEMNDDQQIHFIKTHNYPETDNYPALYIIRDGRDSVISFAHYLQKVEKKNVNYDSLLMRLVEGNGPFGSWSTHVMKWMSRNPKPVIVRYEDLIQDPVEVVRQSLIRLGVATTEESHEVESLPQFESMHEASPDFFRSGKVGQWKQSMSSELRHLFSWRHCNVLNEFGYKESDCDSACLNYDLAEATLDELGVKFSEYDPILEGICMPPYYSSQDHDDFNVLMSIATHRNPDMIFEFGTARGNTVANLCRYTNADITTLNALPRDTSGLSRTYDLTIDQIGEVYKSINCSNRVNQILDDSLKVNLSEHIDGKLYDLIIIDACHDYEYVINDFLKIREYISPNGLVLFHDCHPMAENHTKGVWDACRFLRSAGFDIKHIENTWWGIWVNSDNSQNIDEAALVFMYRLLQTKRDTVRLSQYSELLSNKLDRIRKIPGYMLISKIFRKAGI